MALDPTLLTGAGIGGVIIATCWGMSKVIPVVAKAVRSNGKNSKKNTLECKPGKAQICIKRGEKLVEHEGILNQLVQADKDSKEDRKEIKTKIETGFSSVHARLDKVLIAKLK